MLTETQRTTLHQLRAAADGGLGEPVLQALCQMVIVGYDQRDASSSRSPDGPGAPGLCRRKGWCGSTTARTPTATEGVSHREEGGPGRSSGRALHLEELICDLFVPNADGPLGRVTRRAVACLLTCCAVSAGATL